MSDAPVPTTGKGAGGVILQFLWILAILTGGFGMAPTWLVVLVVLFVVLCILDGFLVASIYP